MKLISVQSRGDRLTRLELLDSRFHPSRIYLYKLKQRDFGAYGQHKAYKTRLFYYKSSALKAAAEWLQGASDE